MVTFVCIEGAHGVGKTTVVEQFRSAGYPVLEEKFLDQKPLSPKLDRQGLIMETKWAWDALACMVKYRKDSSSCDRPVVIVDRSPYSSAVYTKDHKGMSLVPVVRGCIDEMKELGINVITVCIALDRDALWERIEARFAKDTVRAELESSRDFMDEVCSDYSDLYGDIWDATFEVDPKDTPRRAMESIEALVLRIIGARKAAT